MKKIYLLVFFFYANFNFSQLNLNVTINDPMPICNSGDCTSLFANYTNLKFSNDYLVQNIAYNPSYSFNGGTIVNSNNDDLWSSSLSLPFNFCFYGVNYSQILIGSNGVVHFVDGSQTAGGTCQWILTDVVPNTSFPIKNAIYGVYQDLRLSSPPITDYAVQNINYYTVGVAPNRVFVINFNELPQYECINSVGLQTSQILLYETSNIIDVNIKNRSACTSWNYGKGLVGIQNGAGTIAHIPTNRNTGNWSATNESWRFLPNGNSITTLEWYKNGVLFGTSNPIVACPENGDNFEAVVKYNNCSGQSTISASKVLNIEIPINANTPPNIFFCVDQGQSTGTFNLISNQMFFGLDTSLYNFHYYTSLSDANNDTNQIANVSNFTSSGQTIYVAIEKNDTGCRVVKQFDLILEHRPSPPTGESIQYFNQGQTLANLNVTGQNIIWYDSLSNGNVLPNNTLLVDNTTYYAASSTNSGCTSGRNMNAGRLAVLAIVSLNSNSFDFAGFRAWPNPVKEMFNISYTKEISSVSVVNLLGQDVLTKKVNALNTSIDISSLAKGAYLLKVVSGDQIGTIKIVKE